MHVTNVCNKASQKLHTIAHVYGFMSQNKLIIGYEDIYHVTIQLLSTNVDVL